MPYLHILGSLIFLSTRTRPDISTAVSMLGKFQQDPSPKDWKAMTHLLRYLKGTAHMGIWTPTDSQKTDLQAWTDADWARDEELRRSRSGYLLMYGTKPVLWTSRLQAATALSTSEAEFAALASCAHDVVWIRSIIGDNDKDLLTVTTIYQDNLGAITWKNHVQGLRKVKHVSLRYHYVRSVAEDGTIKVLYVPSTNNHAASLAKILSKDMHVVQFRLLGVIGAPVEEAC